MGLESKPVREAGAVLKTVSSIASMGFESSAFREVSSRNSARMRNTVYNVGTQMHRGQLEGLQT